MQIAASTGISVAIALF